MPTLMTGCDYATWGDEELLLEYRKTQNRDAFNQLVIRYERELYSYLCNYLGNQSNAEDVFQTTFVKIIQNLHLFEEGRKFRPWMYTIAINLAKDLLARRKRFSVISIDAENTNEEYSGSIAETLEGKEMTPVDEALNAEAAKQVRDAMEKLPDHYRQALYLVYFQGLKYEEAAESLGIAKGTISGRLRHAITKLNSLMQSGK